MVYHDVYLRSLEDHFLKIKLGMFVLIFVHCSWCCPIWYRYSIILTFLRIVYCWKRCFLSKCTWHAIKIVLCCTLIIKNTVYILMHISTSFQCISFSLNSKNALAVPLFVIQTLNNLRRLSTWRVQVYCNTRAFSFFLEHSHDILSNYTLKWWLILYCSFEEMKGCVEMLYCNFVYNLLDCIIFVPSINENENLKKTRCTNSII